MKRQIVGPTLAIVLCFTATFAFGEPRGKGGEKEGKGGEPHAKGGENKEKEKGEKPGGESKGGNKPPGGAWSDEKQSPGKQSSANREKEAEEKNKSSQATGAEGAAAERAAGKNKSPSATGAEGAAAGAAASNRNKPATSGAEGAAAGAAAANRNKPAASGAEGAAAGAAAANRNKPAASGTEGAAVGAAASRRNSPAASGAEGVAAGAAVANRNAPATSGAVGAAAGYAAVRDSFNHPDLYNEQWHVNNPGAWTATNWPANNVWNATSAAVISSHCGYGNNTPISYGYGDNVTCQNGNVIIDGQNVGSAENYSQGAADLAWIGQSATTQDDDEWLPLGVFALVRNVDQQPQLTLQLAINNEGILRGNYTDLVSDHTLALHGAVEQETQRAAWTVDNKKNFFMEAGLTNLNSGEAPALIHKFGRTEKWLLVRLPKPESVDMVAAEPAR